MFRKRRDVQEAAQSAKDAPDTNTRFQIVKLEERVAPRRGGCYYCYHYPGWYKHGWSGPPGQVR